MDSINVSRTGGRGVGRSGPRASLACMNCRQRKIKCRMTDPSATICQSCRAQNLACVVNKDGDRRKAGSRQHVAALQQRLDYLESYIASGQHDSRLGEPAGSGTSDRSIPSRTNSQDASSTVVNNLTTPVSSRTLSTDHNAFNEDRTPSPRADDSRQNRLGNITPSTDKGRSRLELDENDGGPRFYGPTSQAHIQRNSVPVLGEESITNDEELDIDSLPLRSVLLNAYWKTQPHSVLVVDDELFLNARRRGTRSEYYSAFLEDSLLACASRMSTSSDVRALGWKYVDRAKSAIVAELERPNTATLEGFLLLSDFEATRGRDRLGYIYCGIGCRLVYDLGLHEDCAALVAKGSLSAHEAQWRHTLFITSFVFDKLWSLYTGRPGTIPIPTLKVAHHRALATGWTGPTTVGPWIELCSDISDVTDILNAISPVDDESRQRLLDLDETIKRRTETLPPELVLHEDRVSDLPPNAYSVHVQFHGIRIVLHRVLYKTASSQEAELVGDADHRNFDLERSRAIMYENAIQIAQLVSTYQKTFGTEQIITVMLDNSYVAAIVLISHILRSLRYESPQTADEKDMQRLQALADLLGQAQRHYPVTVRMRFSLSSLVEGTPLAGTFGNFATQDPQEAQASNAPEPSVQLPPPQTFTDSGSDRLQEINDLRPDMAFFEGWGSNGGESIYQEMDMANNMMSWAWSPVNGRSDLPFQ